MKKLFLIPLMTLMTCVMAWGYSTHTAGTFVELQQALSGAANGDVIKLTADIAYPANGALLNITKNLTIDGQGHTLSGYGIRNSNAYPTIGINVNNTANETELTLKDITIENDCHSQAYRCRPIETRGHVKSITLENVIINAPYGDESNAQIITIGGDDSGWCSETKMTEINMTNTKIYAGKSSYCITSFNPYKLNAENCEFHGWCVADMSNPSGSFGSRYSVLTLDACLINTYNKHNAETNAFAAFSLRDGGITINLNGCTMNATELGSQAQWILLLNNFAPKANRNYPVVLNITGDNSNLSDALLSNGWTGGRYQNTYYGESMLPETFSLTVNISGGTYPFNPAEITWFKNGLLEGDDKYAESNIGKVTIPEGYEVKEITMEGVATPLYRVVKKAATKEVEVDDPENPGEKITVEVLYNLNDYVPVEGEGYGDNPVSSFDLSVGDTMKLNQDTTKAGYVQVSDKIVEDPITHEKDTTATIIQVGKTEINPSTSKEEKVDQTLVINNGLDVQGESQVIVQAGSAIVIGEGGINTEKPENIVIEADSTGAASLLLDPTITVNQTPNLTVRMTARQIGRDASNDWYWHRFAMPVDHIDMWEKEGSLAPAIANNYPTYVYAWDYENNDWANIAPSEMDPLQGYTLTLNSKNIAGSAADGKLNVLQDVVYIFKGNLVGNTDRGLNFQHEGFNFFGNSYTGYMDVLTVIQGIESDFVDGTVYMWNNDPSDKDYQTYKSVTLYQLTNARQRAKLKTWQKEVAPMQTFIMRLRGADSANESVSYADAIWGNPRYGNSSSPAPKRKLNTHNGGANDPEQAYFEIVITAANGSADRVEFTELSGLSDAFENGYDAEKFMNEKHFNIYSTLSGVNMSTVVTDHLLGKTLSLQTLDDVNYTISFEYVEGNAYALLDKATNTLINIDNATTYNFSAQPNSTIEGRFEIVERYMVPTGIDQVEGNTNMKGIYTLLGQYVGEDFNALPAGVYIVNGVKVVK